MRGVKACAGRFPANQRPWFILLPEDAFHKHHDQGQPRRAGPLSSPSPTFHFHDSKLTEVLLAIDQLDSQISNPTLHSQPNPNLPDLAVVVLAVAVVSLLSIICARPAIHTFAITSLQPEPHRHFYRPRLRCEKRVLDRLLEYDRVANQLLIFPRGLPVQHPSEASHRNPSASLEVRHFTTQLVHKHNGDGRLYFSLLSSLLTTHFPRMCVPLLCAIFNLSQCAVPFFVASPIPCLPCYAIAIANGSRINTK